MKILSSAIQPLFSSAKFPSCILLYGPDEMEITAVRRKIVNYIKKSSGDVDITQIDYRVLQENPNTLVEEARSRSLFAEKRVIVVANVAGQLGAGLANEIRKLTCDTTFIFLAGDLPKTSQIRKLFESSNEMAAVACYKPNYATIKKIVAAYMQKYSLTYDSEVIDAISACVPASEIAIRNEILKLHSYVSKKADKRVTYQDVEDIISINHESSLDDVCSAIVHGKADKLQYELKCIYNAGASTILIIRALSNFFTRLIRLHSFMANGMQAERAIASLQPPAFFKHRDNLLAAVKKFSAHDASTILKKLIELEVMSKTGSYSDILLLKQTLIMMVLKEQQK